MATAANPKQEVLLRNPGRRYLPAFGGGAWYGSASAVLDGAPVFTWFDVPRMLRDPQVRFALKMWRAPFQQVKWRVRANSAKVQNYVDMSLRRLWRRWLPSLLNRYSQFGCAAATVSFRYDRKSRLVVIDRARVAQGGDATPRIWKEGPHAGKYAGFFLSGGGIAGLAVPSSGGEWVPPSHGIWFAGWEDLAQFYDWPKLAGMFAPWLEKNGRNGAVQSRRVGMRKFAFDGGTMHYPEGTTNLGTNESPNEIDNQDIARQVVEAMENGSTFIASNEPNTADGLAGKYAWDFTPSANRLADTASLRDYCKDLDREILIGADIPPEVLEASEVGSGWSGRMIPLKSFYGGVDELVGPAIEAMDGPIRYGVRANYGDEWYEIEPVPLVDQLMEASKSGPGGGEGKNPVPGLQGMAGKPQPNRSGKVFKRKTRRWVKPENVNLSAFREEDHPRAKDGKFGSGSGGVQGKTEPQQKKPDSKGWVEPDHKTTSQYIMRRNTRSAGDKMMHYFKSPYLPKYEDKRGAALEFLAKNRTATRNHIKKVYNEIKSKLVEDHGEDVLQSQEFKDIRSHVKDLLHKADAHHDDMMIRFDTELYKAFKEGTPYHKSNGVKSLVDNLADATEEISGPGLKRLDELLRKLIRKEGPKRKFLTDYYLSDGRADPQHRSPARLIALAMLAAAEKAARSGKPGKARKLIERLAALSPEDVGSIIGTSLSWVSYEGPKGGRGWKNSETGRIVYGGSKPGEGKERAQASAKRASELLREIVTSAEAGPEHLKELADHIPALPVARLRAARNLLGASFGGQRRRDAMVNALLEHVRGMSERVEKPVAAPDPLPKNPNDPDFSQEAMDDVSKTGAKRTQAEEDAGRIKGYELQQQRDRLHQSEPERFPSKHNPDITYGNRDDRDSDDSHFDREIRRADNQLAKVQSQLDQAEAAKADEDKAAAKHAKESTPEARAAAVAKDPKVRKLTRQLEQAKMKAALAKKKLAEIEARNAAATAAQK